MSRGLERIIVAHRNGVPITVRGMADAAIGKELLLVRPRRRLGGGGPAVVG